MNYLGFSWYLAHPPSNLVEAALSQSWEKTWLFSSSALRRIVSELYPIYWIYRILYPMSWTIWSPFCSWWFEGSVGQRGWWYHTAICWPLPGNLTSRRNPQIPRSEGFNLWVGEEGAREQGRAAARAGTHPQPPLPPSPEPGLPLLAHSSLQWCCTGLALNLIIRRAHSFTH